MLRSDKFQCLIEMTNEEPSFLHTDIANVQLQKLQCKVRKFSLGHLYRKAAASYRFIGFFRKKYSTKPLVDTSAEILS